MMIDESVLLGIYLAGELVSDNSRRTAASRSSSSRSSSSSSGWVYLIARMHSQRRSGVMMRMQAGRGVTSPGSGRLPAMMETFLNSGSDCIRSWLRSAIIRRLQKQKQHCDDGIFHGRALRRSPSACEAGGPSQRSSTAGIHRSERCSSGHAGEYPPGVYQQKR